MISLSSSKVNVIHLLFGYFLSVIISSLIFNSGNTAFPESFARLIQLLFISGWLFLCFYDDRQRIFLQLNPQDYKVGRRIFLFFALIFLAVNFRIGYESLVYHILVLVDSQEDMTNLTDSGSYSLDTILTAVIIGPIVEEVFYRAALITCFRRKYSLQLSILLSSVIFALMHANPYVFIAAVVLSLIYVRFGIVASIVFHSLGNLTLIFLKSNGFFGIIMTFQGPMCFCIFLACLFFYWKSSKSISPLGSNL